MKWNEKIKTEKMKKKKKYGNMKLNKIIAFINDILRDEIIYVSDKIRNLWKLLIIIMTIQYEQQIWDHGKQNEEMINCSFENKVCI